jgi:hypothetical protein
VMSTKSLSPIQFQRPSVFDTVPAPIIGTGSIL